ncbi:ABC transporter substrate-binding protein [Streptomyces flavofungini]|uniref:ABC transporter substrate-binding protein n=1 Tax=Streptomyces flavofungini TaxID=68200 RepID=UPI0025AF5A4B|nr:ABC transporter substrate-binding protein [Streptomyces flavofungini]WJV48025.1 ABC transporter substrate-binding protein [Streptomyces flavofungini]
MTALRRVFPPRPDQTAPRARKAPFGAVVVAACASLAVGCGVIPGTTGGSEDDPVTVMTWAPEHTRATNKPGMPAMAEAYARWVNENGGLDGRKLEVITCNERNSAEGAGTCARQAVKEDVAAVVGSYSQNGRAFMGPLESAGIPYIGGYGLTDEEFSSPLSYPVNGGQPALLAGNGRQLADVCDRVSLVRPDTIAGDNLSKLLDSGLAQGNRAASADIRAPEDGTDYTSQAEQALHRASGGSGSGSGSGGSRGSGAGSGSGGALGTRDAAGPGGKGKEGCVAAALGARTDTFFDSFRRTEDAYPPVRTASVLGSVDQSLVDRTGGADGPYEGAYVTGWYPAASDARWSKMREVIREHAFGDNRVDATDAGTQTTWIAFTVLRQAVESLNGDAVTARSLRRTLDRGLRVDTGGLTPMLRWRFEDMLAAGDYPRLVNADVTFQVVRDGRLVPARKQSVNVAKTLESAH